MSKNNDGNNKSAKQKRFNACRLSYVKKEEYKPDQPLTQLTCK